MGYRPRRMKFGVFLAPFHRMGENPTLALKRDMELIEQLDELGYDEAWIGEHHSFARELISNPMIFIAEAAARTKQIKLGTGVTSLPYHHPLMIADDLLQLDHMTRGRTMLGCGPGALTSDAFMMGIPPDLQRQRMAESLEALMRLTTSDEPVTMKTDWFELNDARLQMSWYSDPHPEIACAATVTPTGPTLAGKHGVGLLSVAGLGSGNFGRVWEWCEEAAAESGQTVERANWRVVVQMHLADTKEQAIADVEEGFAGRAYFGDSKDPGAGIGGLFGGQAATIEEGLEVGNMIVGTPDEAIERIEGYLEQSGGFGTLLSLAHEWAGSAATQHSYELLMRYVAPRFQTQLDRLYASRDFVEERRLGIFGASGDAMAKAFEESGKEMPELLAKGLEQMKKAREKAESGD